jgi:hypothetical protein
MKPVLRCHDIAYLLPVGQVLAVEKRNPRAQLKAGAYEIKIIPYPADGWIRIKTRDNGVG